MARTKQIYNKTQLTPQQEFERHIYHRDQFAHYLRWSHILKVAKIGQTILDFGCGTGEMLELFYRNKYRPKQYLGPEENKEVGEWDHFELQDKLSEYFDIEAKYGTFASIKDYKEEIEGDWRHVMFDELRKYYDTNMLSVIMAPIIKPEHARNCLWVLKAKQED